MSAVCTIPDLGKFGGAHWGGTENRKGRVLLSSGQGTVSLSPISMHPHTLDCIICLCTYDTKNRRQVLPSFIPRSPGRGCLAAPVNICQKGQSPDGTTGEACVSVHGHVPDRSFVHVWIPVCAVTVAWNATSPQLGRGPHGCSVWLSHA